MTYRRFLFVFLIFLACLSGFSDKLYAAPNIITHPNNYTSCDGTTALFEVEAEGSGTLNYQWKRIRRGTPIDIDDNDNYSGTKTKKLEITGVTFAMNGYQYVCVVTDDSGIEIISNRARLRVVAPPTPDISGAYNNVCPYATEIYSTLLVASNTYQWNVTGGGVIVGSSTGSSITVKWGEEGIGTVTVTEYSPYCSVTSAPFIVTIKDITNPVITLPTSPIIVQASELCQGVIPPIPVTVTDNCTVAGNFKITQVPTAGTLADIGITTVYITAIDEAGNSTTESIDVLVVYNSKPEITSKPSDVTATVDNRCQATVPNFLRYFEAIDNCSPSSAITYTQSPVAGSIITGAKTTNVTLKATDANGNSESVVVLFTTEDVTPPTVNTKNATIFLDINGKAVLNVSDVNDGSYDNCSDVLSFSLDKTEFTCADIGTNTVTLTAYDAAGNSTQKTAEVTVINPLQPVVKVKPFNLVLDANGTGILNPWDVDNGSYSNCAPVSLSVFPNTFTCADGGKQTVVLTVTDSNGNSNSESVEITVSSALTISDITLSNCIGFLLYPGFTATPSGGTAPYYYSWGVKEAGIKPFYNPPVYPMDTPNETSTHSNPLFDVSQPVGLYHITLTVTDANGCSVSTEFVINHTGYVFDNNTFLYSEACEGETKDYSVTSTAISYLWSITNGTILSGHGTSVVTVIWDMGVIPGTEGTLICNITTNLSGTPCTFFVNETVTLNPTQLPPAFNPPVTPVCAGSEHTYSLSNFSSSNSYIWEVTGGFVTGGGSSTDDFVKVLWGSGISGQITVTVTSSSSSCSSTASENITINPQPIVTLTSSAVNDISCAGTDVTFTASVIGGANYEFFVNGASKQNNSSNTFTTNTLINGDVVYVVVTDGGCSATSAGITNFVKPMPVATLTSSKSGAFCEGTPVTFTASGGTNYDFRVDGISHQNSPSATYTTTSLVDGEVVDVVVTSAGGCSATSAGIPVSVIPVPVATLTSDKGDAICAGTTVTFTASSGGTNYDFRINGISVQNSSSETYITPHLVHGDVVDVVVTNGGCSATSNKIDITVHALPTATITSGDMTICEGETASITVTLTKGLPPWSVTISDGTTSYTENDIDDPFYKFSIPFSSAGAYTYIITSLNDANLCTASSGMTGSATITVNPLPAPAGLISSSHSTICQGTQGVTFSVAPILYATDYIWTLPDGATIVGGANTNSITVNFANNAVSGDITVKGANGDCEGLSSTLAIAVNESPKTTIVSNKTTICEGESVSITVTLTAGTLPWSFTYSDGTTDITEINILTNTFTFNVTPTSTTTYTIVSVSDATCTVAATESVTITVNALPTATISGTTTICEGESAEITVTLATGSTPWSFVYLHGSVYTPVNNIEESSNTFSVGPFLNTGTYTYTLIHVTAANCTDYTPKNITITVNARPTATVSGDATICEGESADITVTLVTGAMPWSFTYSDGTTDITEINILTNTFTFSVTPTSTTTYTISVSDANCTAATSESVTITVNPLPTATITSGDASICDGGSTNIIINLTGTAPWSLTYNDGTADNTVSGITDATYTLSVTPATTTIYTLVSVSDANCIAAVSESVVITVNQLPVITSSDIDVVDVLCKSLPTGSINITAAGDMYSIDGGTTQQVSNLFEGLTAGVYSVVVINANGCVSVPYSVTITEPSVALSISIINIDDVSVYDGSDGSVTVAGVGGTAPYEYSIDGSAYQTSDTFNNLAAGTYTITVRDANGCTAEEVITIIQPVSIIEVLPTDVLCFGASTGSVTVAADGGTAPYEYSIDGVTYQTDGTFNDLAAGTYTLYAKDINGLTASVIVEIFQPSALSGTEISKTNVLCYGAGNGNVEVEGLGGTAPYQYMLSGSFQPSGFFDGLAAGSYTITIQDANNCETTITVTISEPAEALSGIANPPINVTCKGGSDGRVTVTASGGVAPYQFSINGGTPQTSNEFTGLAAGNYTVSIVDANGCVFDVPVVITEPAALSIAYNVTPSKCPDSDDGSVSLQVSGGLAPYTVIWSDGNNSLNRTDLQPGTYTVIATDANGCATSTTITVGSSDTGNCIVVQDVITPNGDGFNDTWKIRNIEQYPNAEVFVYNRWGELVFSTKNISANEWDGTSRGRLLPTDSYHYILYLNDGSKPRSGVVSIIRER